MQAAQKFDLYLNLQSARQKLLQKVKFGKQILLYSPNLYQTS
ncbi:hypothetical protein [Campylobacter concisus]|nr:hypothetical protein [Campylobacter concisus]